MKVKILRFNEPDSQGDVFLKDSIQFENPIKLSRNFDPSQILGETIVSQEDDGLYAEIDVEKFKGLYPSIGYSIERSSILDGIINISTAKLHWVGLCDKENIDPEIKPL